MAKTTKRNVIISSLLTIVLCVCLLAGSTYAWFTDTAKTNVSSVVSGTLDVALEMEDDEGSWVSAENKTLNFKVEGKNTTDETVIYWEPNCTYELPKLRVVNKGNLAIKYKVAITGISGDVKLNEVIEWTMNGVKLTSDPVNDLTLAPEASHEFVIKGHMLASAGNEYQNLSINNIAITVYATQASYESDSTDNTYDADAEYPVCVTEVATVEVENNEVASQVVIESSQVVSTTDSTPVATVTVPAGVKTTRHYRT